MNIYSLDVETRSVGQSGPNTYALEPWRVRQGKAEISSIAVCRPDDSVIQIVNSGQADWVKEVYDLLESLAGRRVFCHNAVFDVAWNIVTLEPNKFKPIPSAVSLIQWADTMLLVKWLINGQLAEDSRLSYSLKNLVETFLPEHPMTADFVAMKSKFFAPGEDEQYWQERGNMDVIMTRALAEKFMILIPESMRTGLMTEWSCIVPIANSWINGIKIDVEKIEEVETDLVNKMDEATSSLGVDGSVINSPKQLGKLLFEDWSLTPWSYTPTKTPSTAGDDLMWIQYGLKSSDPGTAGKLGAVLAYKTNKTLKSKYIDTLKSAIEYTGDGHIYGAPKIFGTYTSRMTYSNTTVKNGPKCSIALHQLPRKAKSVRSLMIAPEGYGVVEVDSSGQESRIMAIASKDDMLIKIFTDDLNFHAITGAAIIGMDYNEFMKRYKENDTYIIEQRQLGKLTNLSSNYRIGGKALAEKAFTTYDTYMTVNTGMFLVNTFARQYPGIPKFWSDAIKTARELGYTESFSGKRYKICKWGDNDRWMSESSAINFPIQASGSDQTEVAISVLGKMFPDNFLSLQLHDGLFYYTQLDKIQDSMKSMTKTLDDIDYEAFWNREIPIPLPFEGVWGNDFGGVK